MGATWTYGISDPTFADRGTGYNYFDGSAWGPIPEARIESIRAGWPSYAPYGVNGELVVSHDFANGDLIIETREQKGSGDWAEGFLIGPGDVPISWPRATTSGVNHSVIQILALTWPVANGGPIYQGLDGAILYSRSTDGGATLDPMHIILEGLSSDNYFGFSADIYEWAVTDNDNIAFLVGDSWRDLVLMKSTNGGDSWNKTVIWENPYPFFDPATPYETDTFYCADGSHHLAFDSEDMVHVVFGINRAYADAGGTYWFSLVDGVGYWNENRPTFSNSMDALNPYGEAGSELEENYSLIGWMQDLNGNDSIDVLAEVGFYYVGASSMPQLLITDEDELYVVYSSVTEGYDNTLQNYRHLWARYSTNGENWGNFIDLNASILHTYDECVFPSIASNSDDSLYLIYQIDELPGLAVRGDEDDYTNNTIWFMKQVLSDMMTGTSENNLPVYDFDVMQNYPNPASGLTTIEINVRTATDLTVEVVNMIGQKVITIHAGKVKPGMNHMELDVSNLTSGVYFYSVNAGDAKVTKKMIVE
jgi:hypothetical protein